MLVLVTAAAVAMVSAGAAQAAVVDLTYTLEAEITSVEYYDPEDYGAAFSRQVGDNETLTFRVRLDTDRPDASNGNGVIGSSGSGDYRDVDVTNGSGSFFWNNADTQFEYELFSDGTGIVDAIIPISGTDGTAFEDVLYTVSSFTVDGLPIAPVPLPASALLLLAGIGGFAFVRGRAA